MIQILQVLGGPENLNSQQTLQETHVVVLKVD